MSVGGRRLAERLGAAECAALQSAMWNGQSWSIPRAAPEVLAALAREKLVEERGGIWMLTWHGHRCRRFAERRGHGA